MDTLEHPSIRGFFFRKYTSVHGSIHSCHDLRKDANLNKVLKEHTSALRRKLLDEQVTGPLMYVMFDEWLDSNGSAVTAISIGRGALRYLVEVVQLTCQGPK